VAIFFGKSFDETFTQTPDGSVVGVEGDCLIVAVMPSTPILLLPVCVSSVIR